VARVGYLHRDEADEQGQPLYDRLEAERKMPPPNLFLALAHAPEQLGAFLSCANSLRAAELGKLRELIILTVGHVTGCDYDVAHHQSHALAAGLTPEQIAALPHFETADVFDDFDRSVMRLAAQFSTGSDVPQEMWDVVAARLTTRQMVQFTLTLTWYLSAALMVRVLDLDLEEGYPAP
jgi:AhpD family alkylhydroperoxidase